MPRKPGRRYIRAVLGVERSALSLNAILKLKRCTQAIYYHHRHQMLEELLRRSLELRTIGLYRRARRVMSDWSDEETDEPLIADHRNFYKVEQWSRDGQRVERMLFAGNSLDRARAIFKAELRRRPRGRYTIRQRTRVLECQC